MKRRIGMEKQISPGRTKGKGGHLKSWESLQSTFTFYFQTLDPSTYFGGSKFNRLQ